MPTPSVPPQANSEANQQANIIPQANINPQANSHYTFTPFIPADVSRYENRPRVVASGTHVQLPELTRRFHNQSCTWLTEGWQSCVHPEGALYLYNDNLKTYTEANTDKKFCAVKECVDSLWAEACNKSVDLIGGNIELVVQVDAESEKSCKYYFVDHGARTLFWLVNLNEKIIDDIFDAIQVYDLTHMGYALEQEYWKHCEYYPNHEMNRTKLVKELRELVMHASAEIITSDASLSPFDAEELSTILDLISHLQENASETDDGSQFLHSNCIIARFMHYFYRAKFFNFCGLLCARLDADKSVYHEATDFHPLTRSLSFALEAMLFWAPRARLEALRRVWVDESVIMPRWKDFNKNLMDEWTGITIYSTVMLAVDVSFLAVPNVNIGSSQSIGVIATYLSIILLTGSLIVSLLLARQNQKYGAESADRATDLLLNMTGTFFGVKALATIHSLPFAMLMWGMIYFAVALLYNVFKSTTIAMLASVVSGCTVVTMFIMWFIWTAKLRQLRLDFLPFLNE